MTHHVLKVATEADKDRAHDVVSAQFGERRWNRGDSGAQLAWYVSAQGRPGITLWGFEDEPGVVFVDLWDDPPEDQAAPSAGEIEEWRRAHLRRVVEAGLLLGQPVSASEGLLSVLAELGHDSVELEPTASRRAR